ncbi:hypothetical protein RP20_CCG009769 [Aedes albopictus]|nr:hypothetical protein RP20_CCG009769 [Aedes albopictus]
MGIRIFTKTSLPRIRVTADANDGDGAAVEIEKKDEEEPKTSRRTKNPSKRKMGKRSLDSSQGQPDEAREAESVVKVEIKEMDVKRDELVPESSQDKTAQPKKRGRMSKQSLPSESEKANDTQGTVVKVENKQEEVQATKEPLRKRAKRSLDTSQGQPDEGSVAVKVEKKDVERKRPIRPKREPNKEPKQEPTDTKAEEGSNGFARGYVVENLVGITQEGNKFLFLVKWQGLDEMEMVPSAEVRKFVPEMMIDFYETRIIWRKKDQAGKLPAS